MSSPLSVYGLTVVGLDLHWDEDSQMYCDVGVDDDGTADPYRFLDNSVKD